MCVPIPAEDERIAHAVIGAAIEVHRILGPGFLESIYRKALRYELMIRGFSCAEEMPLLVQFKDLQIDGQRVDLLVERRVIVELKCAEKFAPIHEAILLSYLKSTNLRLGLLLNFKAVTLKEGGIRRVVL
ncbi:MAG TPA: GxxExxY protein [Lacipirellulaceae bacterium]|nr:GxxExxY protein [Lacipirellulaceae bacterium]